ncbi:MAG: carbohydrate-binding protein [Paludibacteraceae bacterium]|nr:carbohydrate-binding protein [Paludibacteraceae bacterium]
MKKNKLFRIAFLLCFWGMSALAQADPDPNFHIYICFGQSNMEGNATVPSSETQGVSERFQRLYTADNCSNCGKKKGEWYTAVPPLARCFHGNNIGYGPVDNFGRTLVENLDPAIRVGVVVVACGGCDIELFEKNRCVNYINSAQDWLKNYARDYGGNPYERMIEMAKLAKEVGVIKGILVHQGENNSGQTDWPDRLKGVYGTILSDVGLKAEEVPLLVGEVRHSGPCSGHNQIIANVPNVIPTAYVISSDGCESAGDQYHFSVKGYKELGKRYAEKMLELLGDNPLQATGISLSAMLLKDSEPGSVQINVTPDEEIITRFEIYADGEVIANDVTEFLWEDVSRGTHSVWAVGYDADGKDYTTSKVKLSLFEPQLPFNGTPALIPGVIEAEEFDYGGEGNAYHDNDEQNRNKGDRQEGVDMSNTAVGYAETGEWIEYTVEVQRSGTYELESTVASDKSSGSFTLYMDNNFIIPGADGTPGGFVEIPNTGGYSDFTTVKTKLNKLTKGVHVLKLEVTGSWFDLDKLEFKLLEPDPDEDDTNVESVKVETTVIPDGVYNAYDVKGGFLRSVNVEKNACGNQLKNGYYLLMNELGKVYPMLINNRK